MERFAAVAEQIAAHPSKLDKIALLAQYFRTLDDADLLAAARFFSGSPFAARDRRTLAVGGRSIVEVARRVWGFDDAELSRAYRDSGDLGAALGALVREPRDAMLFRDRLTPARLDALFGEIAAASGKRSNRRREAVLEEILRAGDAPPVATYVVKIITGDLRVGLREGLVLDAIARAFDADTVAVRRGAMASGDVGAVALASKHGTLSEIRVDYGTPIGFMLATPVTYGEVYKDLGSAVWHFEDKYDGIRAQAHVCGGAARLFSRGLNDVSASYPEVVEALARISDDAILDGEIVAMRDGRVQPFRMLQARLQRKSVETPILQEVPIAYIVFDVLAAGDELLIDEPLAVRRERLAELFAPSEHVLHAAFETQAELAAGDVNARFEAARARGNEGLMLKRADSPYAPGRRGKWWLKLKRELSTLDVVVIAVEWGNGKRSGVLSDYTFAVRDADRLLTIGKAYSGLTDAEIAELTQWFLDHRLPRSRQREKARASEIPVEPRVVLEVAFDVVQESDLHESGFSLRFPRIVRVRDDKPLEEIDTLQRVREIYREMLAREGAGPKASGV
ncbi:MAG: ATP-dependent DNA ligase [Candidatus Eremiobacteraeota bacterium]|nr:ATP-dependent DNA ligase [Candidatus Eremiobacteraeota bacterium]